MTKSPYQLLPGLQLVLGSGSPRRKELLSELGFPFIVRVSDSDESAPEQLSERETVCWVARSKAQSLLPSLAPNEIVLCADTEVWQNGRRFGKPTSAEEAMTMLRQLQGRKHTVISAVCVTDGQTWSETSCVTTLYFRPLSDTVLRYYIEQYRPFDKAGAWGAQEFIGYVGIDRMEGSYTNVVGLPIPETLDALAPWLTIN